MTIRRPSFSVSNMVGGSFETVPSVSSDSEGECTLGASVTDS
jgi:hypothetical protein